MFQEYQVEKRSLFDRFKRKFGLSAQHKEDIDEVRSILGRTMADRQITDQEHKQIKDLRSRISLTDEEFAEILGQTFSTVVNEMLNDRRIAPFEKQQLHHLAERLDVSAASVAELDRQLEHYELLYNIEELPFEGLPASKNTGVVCKKGEIAYFAAPGSLLQERVVRSHVRGSSSGVSFRLMKGVSYRVGASRGVIEAERQLVPVSYGKLVVTNQRLVFDGDRKSVNAPFGNIVSTELYHDGIRFSHTTRQTPALVRFDNSEHAEIIGSYVSRILNQ